MLGVTYRNWKRKRAQQIHSLPINHTINLIVVYDELINIFRVMNRFLNCFIIIYSVDSVEIMQFLQSVFIRKKLDTAKSNSKSQLISLACSPINRYCLSYSATTASTYTLNDL